MRTYAAITLLTFGLISNALAENAVIDSLRLTATNQASTPWISMPHDESKPLLLISDNLDRDFKLTEQRLQVELTDTLAEKVSKLLPAN